MRMLVSILARVWYFVDRALSLLAYGVVLFYRRYISPHKGFRCAHAALTGGPSCSTIAVEVLCHQPLSVAFPAIQGQRALCRDAYMEILDGGSTYTETLLNSPLFAQGNTIIKCC